jgi:thiamine transport system substrate-binding protein
VKISFVKSGDTGAALNRAILSKDAPLADVFYGVDKPFLSRALEADLFEAYPSPLLEKIRLSSSPMLIRGYCLWTLVMCASNYC